jgi:gluconolactonase
MNAVRSLLGMLGTFLVAAAPVADQPPIPGIGPASQVTRLHTGFQFTEGPASDAEGNLYFTDVRVNRIHKVSKDGELSTFLEDSQGCNGLMFDRRGRLLACQGGARRIIAIDVESKKIDVLADSFEGKPFDRPNDLSVDRQGGVYFTDPGVGAVYYVAPDGAVSKAAGELPRPNGVLLSPDEKTLYVLPSGSPDARAYPVEAPGKLGTGKILCRLQQAENGPVRGGDGLTVDTQGNLYLTQPALGAIQVVSPDGKILGLIEVPESPSNCAFGGADGKTLFITARTSLYAAPMEATGHRPVTEGR